MIKAGSGFTYGLSFNKQNKNGEWTDENNGCPKLMEVVDLIGLIDCTYASWRKTFSKKTCWQINLALITTLAYVNEWMIPPIQIRVYIKR